MDVHIVIIYPTQKGIRDKLQLNIWQRKNEHSIHSH